MFIEINMDGNYISSKPINRETECYIWKQEKGKD